MTGSGPRSDFILARSASDEPASTSKPPSRRTTPYSRCALSGAHQAAPQIGGPLGVGPFAGKADEVSAEWRRSIGPLAECPNVCARLGGIAMEVNRSGWHEREAPPTSEALMEATRRYYDHTIEVFGVGRANSVR